MTRRFWPKKKKSKPIELGTKFVSLVEKKPRKKLEEQTWDELYPKADKLFALAIKKKYEDEYGYCACYTCGKRFKNNGNFWLHNGHFVNREYWELRWDWKNCRPQGYECNVKREGAKLIFEHKLRLEYSDEIVDEMKSVIHRPNLKNRELLIETIKYLRIYLKQK